MDPDLLFRLANGFVLIGWLPLLLRPDWRFGRIVSEWAVPIVLSLAYAVLLGASFGKSDGSFSTLDGVARLFSVKEVLLAGWLHYLAFDLLIGNHIVEKARGEGIPLLLLWPVLAATFMIGPVGYLLSLLLRSAWARLGRRTDGSEKTRVAEEAKG